MAKVLAEQPLSQCERRRSGNTAATAVREEKMERELEVRRGGEGEEQMRLS